MSPRNKEMSFSGFSAETVFFLKNLKENNNREWFLARKKDYTKKVLEPAAHFVVEMGKLLQQISPGIHAEPKVNRSIYRIYRDTRYSNNKDPYKTHLGIWFWYGTRKIHESPGYYFELRPEEVYLSVGINNFSRKLLNEFRVSVADTKKGEELQNIIEKIEKTPDYQINNTSFKTIPEGYQVEGKRAELIRYNGLLASSTIPIPPELYNQDLLKVIFRIFKDLSPIYNWLTKYIIKGK